MPYSVIRMMTCLLVVLFCCSAEAAVPRVETVSAEVMAEHSLPPIVKQRMEKSVQNIADQLLSGNDINAVHAKQSEKERLIRDVFDKVLVGYTVKRVRIVPQSECKVVVELIPWSDTIKTVKVNTVVEGMPPRVEKLARRDVSGIDTVFASTLTGLPIAAADWTNGVLKHSVESYMAEHLPEFRADFELQADEKASVSLVIYPRLPVVRTIDLAMRSDTVPNFTLLNHRELMQEKVNDLVGVPVAFVKRHSKELADEYAKELDSLADFKALAMQTKVKIAASERLQVMSRSDTTRYRLRLIGWQDIGHDDNNLHKQNDNLQFRFHAGQMLSQQDELFLLVKLMPQYMNWGWECGYDRLLHQGMHGQIRYDMKRHNFILAAAKDLTKRVTMRYEYRLADNLSEAGLGYKLHDFLSIEYVFDSEQNWLRFIGNF